MPDNDVGEGIVPNELPQHGARPAKLRVDFKPWHRIRKQYIREKQWNPAIKYIAQRFLKRDLDTRETHWTDEAGGEGTVPESIRVERPLRCFLLPGDELLDVRSMWRYLQSEGCYLRYLGFNKSVQNVERRRQVDVAESALSQLPRMCKESRVTADNLQDLGRSESQAYRVFREYGPYDVVNLDLCDSLLPRGVANETSGNYAAIHQIVRYQLENQKGPWLLFATTQVDRRTASQSEINPLAIPTRQNCDTHSEFAQALLSIIPGAVIASDTHAIDISHLDENQLLTLFGVMLGKWLVKILSSSSPRCSVKMLTSYRYIISPENAVNMLSLGFQISPHYSPPIDSTGLSQLNVTAVPPPDELETALGLVEVARGIKDIQTLLDENPTLKSDLITSKADLLEAVGFDRSAFIDWVNGGEGLVQL
jgi:hypothetical protein